jgi:hypothetical protein
MGRDFYQAIADVKCWDQESQRLFDAHGEAVEDLAMQSREELVGLCQLIERARIRSYLEIGIWTGRLVTTLHELFDFDLVAACDQGYAERFDLTIQLPPVAVWLRGNSESEEYRRWRAGLGHVDLVLIDADHSYRGVKRDFEINRGYPHRFLAFHDIVGATPQTAGVARFWRELDVGHKAEIVRPHAELGLEQSIMGIGIWSESEVPPVL